MVTDLIIGSSNTVTYSNSGNANAGGTSGSAFNSLLVEGSSLATMTLNQHSDSLNAGVLQ